MANKTEVKTTDTTKKDDTKTNPQVSAALAAAGGQAQAISKYSAMAEEDAGSGPKFDKDDIAVPRLVILQALSPQVTKGKDEYIKEATPGSIFETVNKTLFDGEKGIRVVPVTYRRAYIEWTPREDGGGFVKDHGTDANVLKTTTKDDKGRDMTADGNEIVTTGEYFVLLLEESGNIVPMVISMAKTQLKKSRRWNTLLQQLMVPRSNGQGTYNPAPFFRSYLLSVVPESNDKGSWFSWDITPGKNTLDLTNGEAIYMQARQLRDMVNSGTVKAAAPVVDGEGTSDTM